MSHLHALIFGIIQGLTEFFPVSSSAHVQLAKMAVGTHNVPIIFDLACHLGSLTSLIWFFRKEIVRILFRDQIQILYLFLALVPLVPGYFVLGPLREFAAKPQLLGLFLIGTGGILLAGQKVRFKRKGGPIRDVLMIGAIQSAALIPGISRSASTISCAQALGWSAKKAVRFSFLLAIPTIIGGNLFEARRLAKSGALVELLSLHCLTGFFAALIVGLCIIRLALKWLERGKLKGFAWYCVLLGLGTLGAMNAL